MDEEKYKALEERVHILESLLGLTTFRNVYLHINDVCEMFGISRTQLQRWEKAGLKRHYVGKSPRFLEHEIRVFKYQQEYSHKPKEGVIRHRNKVVITS